MSTDVITVSPSTTLDNAIKLMGEKDISYLLVVDKENKNPIGLLNEMDIISRGLPKGKKMEEIKVEEVMTKPIITCKSDAYLVDAMRMMARHKIRRLPIVEEGKLIGILTSSDVISVVPELIEILLERSRGEGELALSPAINSLSGFCDECGEWSDNLREIDGPFICEECLINK